MLPATLRDRILAENADRFDRNNAPPPLHEEYAPAMGLKHQII